MSKFLSVILLIVVALFIHCNSHADEAKKMERHITSLGAAAHSAPEIALEIIRAAEAHKIEPKLYAAMIAVESMFQVNAYNKHTLDYGIAQINHLTAAAYGFDTIRLQTDMSYNLYAGAHILAYFKRRYAKTEPKTWYCRYNVGTGVLQGDRLEKCTKYVKLVKKYLR